MRQIFIGSDLAVGATAQIIGDDHFHLTRSLRARPGETLLLVDRASHRFTGDIEGIQRDSLTVRVRVRLDDEAEPLPLRLALCEPKADALDAALDAAVQLGATEIIPLSSIRAQKISDSRRGRWPRLVREACCQSLRAHIPRVAAEQPLASFLKQDLAGLRLIAIQGGGPMPLAARQEAVTLLIGPEGGFDEIEVALAKEAGWTAVALGPHILRVPVAASAALGAVQAMRQQ